MLIHLQNRPRRRRGFTLLELVIAMSVLLAAFGIFSTTVAGVHTQQVINWQHGIASNAARSMVERMRNEDFAEVFAQYNADTTDDVGGLGTAPGHRFAVADLRPASDSPDGLHGEIQFPSLDVSVGAGGGGGKLGEVKDGAGAGAGAAPSLLELRESLALPLLGMPRDLNGDSIIDEADHSEDYVILPVRVVVRWAGEVGDHQYVITTTLCHFNWD